PGRVRLGGGGREVGGQLLVVPHTAGQGLCDPVDLVEQDAGVGRALGAVAGRGAGDERVDVRGHAGRETGGWRDVLVDVLVGDRDRGLARVGLLAGEQLVEDHAHRVHVGARVAGAVDNELGG